MKIAIIGGSGCIGRNLIKYLSSDYEYEIISSYLDGEDIPTNNEVRKKDKQNLKWKTIDLSNVDSITKFLGDSEKLIYLVHSLDKEEFIKKDNKYAHNVALASKKTGIKHIIYMGGIIPNLANQSDLSNHLKSRMQTGQNLTKTGIPLTELRASIVIGQCSSSFNIVYNISKKFHIIIAPTQIDSLCSPIYIDDVVKIISKVISTKTFNVKHQIINIGNKAIKYSDLLRITRKSIYNDNLKIIRMPGIPVDLLAKFYGILYKQNPVLISHLFQSLKNNTVADPKEYEKYVGTNLTEVSEAIGLTTQKLIKSSTTA